jgi:hypothetical protein
MFVKLSALWLNLLAARTATPRYLIGARLEMASASLWLEKAKECARLAQLASDPLEARLLRALEQDFLAKAKAETETPAANENRSAP